MLHSGSLRELLARLGAHTLDRVLSNRRVQEDAWTAWRCRRIARQQVCLVGPPRHGIPSAFRTTSRACRSSAVVVIDELRAGVLEEYATVPNLHEEVFAISVRRHFQHPLVRPLLEQAAMAALTVPG